MKERNLLWLTLQCSVLCLSAQWNVVPDTQTGTLNGVIGPAGGYLGISNVLYRSTDSGASWTAWTPTIGGLPIVAIFRDAYYVNGSTIVMAGGIDLDNQHGIVRSTDGGNTWTPVYSNSSGNWPRRINDMHFISSDVGFATGSNGRVIKTTNGGATWTALIGLPGGLEGRSVTFFNNSIGLVAGAGQIWRTTNGGSSWTTMVTAAGDSWMDRNQAGLVAVATQGAIHLSSDQGLSWSQITSPCQNPKGISLIDSQRMMVIESDAAYFTTSGGSYWERADLPAGVDLRDLFFHDADFGCIVGGQPSGTGLLLVTENGYGVGYPVASISTAEVQACGSTDLQLSIAPVAPSWSVQWTLNGEPVGSGPSLSLTFTESTMANVQALVSNGTNTTTLTSNAPVVVSQPFAVDAGPDVVLCQGNSTMLNVLAPPNSTFSWSPTTGLSQPSSANPIVSGITGTLNYTVSVSNGPCSVSDQILVEQLPPPPPDAWSQIMGVPYQSTQAYDFADAFNGVFVRNNQLLRTSDGGETWSSQPSPISGSVQAEVRMVDPFFGLASWDYTLYMTTDGWATSTSLNQSFGTVFANNTYKKPFFKSKDTLLVVKNDQDGFGVVFAMSFTGGLHWQDVSPEFPNRVYDVLFLNDSTILAVGGNPGSSSLLIRSDDHGLTWTHGPFPGASSRVRSIDRHPNGTLYANAEGASVLISTDGGITWGPSTAPGSTDNASTVDMDILWIDDQTAFMKRVFFYKTLNGGSCWHVMDTPGNASFGRGVHHGGLTYFMTQGFEQRRIFRLGTPSPGLRFTLSSDTICFGGTPQAVNNSIGFDSFEWWLDGQLVSTAVQPTLPLVGTGDHTLMLVGYQGVVPTQETKTFHVEDFQLVPEVFLPEEPCWANAPLQLSASADAPVLGFHWYRVSSQGNPISLGAPYAMFVNTTIEPVTYYARAISGSGCYGPPSDSLTVFATDLIPQMYEIQGFSNVCHNGQPTTHSYSVQPYPAATDIIGYQWHLTPSSAGTLVQDDNSCTITWDPSQPNGYASVSVHAIDACGISPPRIHTVQISYGHTINQQPQPVTVAVGEPFSLSVVTSSPPLTGIWHKVGESALATGTTYSVNNATMDMSGLYFWRALYFSGACILNSDTVAVVVTDVSTGYENSDPDNLSVWPNPANNRLWLRWDHSELPIGANIRDGLGRLLHLPTIWNRADQTATIPLEGLPVGCYFVELTFPKARLVSRFSVE
jgi:photosystem II stability/assembly factor-like uncharacterized protein